MKGVLRTTDTDPTWQTQLGKLLADPSPFLILVHGATSLEPIAEQLQPRRTVRGPKRSWFRRRARARSSTSHVTARYAVAAPPVVQLLLDAFVGDLDRLDHGRDPVGELRFKSVRARRQYLNQTAQLAVPDLAVHGGFAAVIPLFGRIAPPHADGRVVLMAEMEPGTEVGDDWARLRELAPKTLGERVGIALADPEHRLKELSTPPSPGLLVVDATHDPAFQRPKRGDRPVRAGLGIEPVSPRAAIGTERDA